MGNSTSKVVVDNCNYLIATLSIDIHVKEALLESCRDTTFVKVPLPADGVDLFNFFKDPQRKKKLDSLLKQKSIYQDQYDLLLPQNCLTDSKNWDVTIITRVAGEFLFLPNSSKAIIKDAQKSRNGIKHGNPEEFKQQHKFDDTMDDVENLLIKLNYAKMNDFHNLRNKTVQIDLKTLMNYHKTLMTNMQNHLINEQTKASKDILKQVIDYYNVKREPSQTVHPSKILRVEKITPKEVAFTAEETSIIYTVQCWKIKNETKMIEPVKNVTSTNINQKAWIQCEVDIKSGYTYEFVFNTDRADDSKIIVQLPRNHHHTSRKGETLVYAHNCGRPSNIHAFEVSDENGITDDDTCIPISTGPSVANTVKEFNQRAMQYYKDHIGVKTFPPSYYVRNVNMKEVIASLEEHSSLLGGKILVGYNPISHLRILGLNDEKIESVLHFSECPDYYDNTIVCIYPNHGLLFVFVVSENEKHIDKDLAKVNAVLKTWCYVHRQILENEQFTIVGVLVLPASSNLNKMKQHPCLNLNTKSQDFVISFDENFGQWLTNFLN
ncbi:uncharacterized protein [Clytia hemisphaerica]|uniref:Uncharacterized protein n=1 Tax=Clytia hemisphaerica TaxID=252671 RepID=A0A7M6DRF0_9CNID